MKNEETKKREERGGTRRVNWKQIYICIAKIKLKLNETVMFYFYAHT